MTYRARGAAAALFGCTAPEVLIEGPAGTGKTRAVMELLNFRAEQHPGCRILICRRTRVSMTESVLVTYENKVLWPRHPAVSGTSSRANRHSYEYPNGSEIIVGGLDNPDRIMSTEYDFVYLAEATEASQEAWEKLQTRLRHGRAPIQQAIADCNPAHPGHWLNQRALEGRMARLLSRHADNPSVSAEYLKTLANLTGHRRARLFEGRWVAAEGTVFGADFCDANLVDPFPIPQSWPAWAKIDPGYDHPCAVTFSAVAPNGCRYTFDEIYERQNSIPEIAAKIKDCIDRHHGLTGVYLDPRHGFARTQQSPVTIAEQFAKAGIDCQPWPAASGTEIDASVNYHRKAIIDRKYKVFSRCVNVIMEHQSWSYKRSSTGELTTGDDAYEDRNNHALDTIMGWERTNPQHIPGGITIGQAARSRR